MGWQIIQWLKMESIFNELNQQVLKQLKSRANQQQIEVQFRLGTIHMYNQQASGKINAIQPLYYQLPNKKIVKHHQFRAQLEESHFKELVARLKGKFEQYREHLQTDYIFSDESKLTLENLNNTRQIVKSVKKQPLMQDIDITTVSPYDARFSCKSISNIEINTKTMQPQTQRTKQLLIFTPIYYSANNSIDIVCSQVQRIGSALKQDTLEVEIKTTIFANQQDSAVLEVLKDLYGTLNLIIQLTQS